MPALPGDRRLIARTTLTAARLKEHRFCLEAQKIAWSDFKTRWIRNIFIACVFDWRSPKPWAASILYTIDILCCIFSRLPSEESANRLDAAYAIRRSSRFVAACMKPAQKALSRFITATWSSGWRLKIYGSRFPMFIEQNHATHAGLIRLKVV